MLFELSVTRVFVTDWERAVRFYTQTVGIPTTIRDDEAGWEQLATGSSQLALERVARHDAEGHALVGRFVGASLRVVDVTSAYEQLWKRGVQFEGPPQQQDWGGLLVHFRDPGGNIISLVSDG